MIDREKFGIGFEKMGYVIAGTNQPIAISHQVREFKGKSSCLPSSEKFSRTPDLQVGFSNSKAVVSFLEDFQALSGDLSGSCRSKEKTIGLSGSAPHASSKLMELGESESLRVLDDHDGGVGDVDAHLDDGGRDEEVDLAAREVRHHGCLVLGGQASVEQPQAQPGESGRGGEPVVAVPIMSNRQACAYSFRNRLPSV